MWLKEIDELLHANALQYNYANIMYKLLIVIRFWKTDQVVTNSILSNNNFKY